MLIKEINATTGEEIVREATEAEIAQRKADALESKKIDEAKAAKETAKAALLVKLGITEDEAKLLLGGN